MQGFYQWETAGLELIICDEDDNPKAGVLDDLKDVVVSIAQGTRQVDWHLDELDIDAPSSKITLRLTQEKAGKFAGDAPAKVQVNILYLDGERDVTVKGDIDVLANLYRKVMD